MHKEKHIFSMFQDMGEVTANLHSGKLDHSSCYYDKELSGHLRQIILMYRFLKNNNKWLYHSLLSSHIYWHEVGSFYILTVQFARVRRKNCCFASDNKILELNIYIIDIIVVKCVLHMLFLSINLIQAPLYCFKLQWATISIFFLCAYLSQTHPLFVYLYLASH